TTISIMIISSILAFMGANFYYQQKLKDENDRKNTEIARDMAAYIAYTDDSVDSYFSHIAKIGYQVYVVGPQGEAQFYGADFREENLAEAVIDRVLAGDIYHGMAEFP